MPATPSAQSLASFIDHTKLTFAPGEDEEQAIKDLCQEAKTHGFAAVCVRPRHVKLCTELLTGTTVQVATVIGFPQTKVQKDDEDSNPTLGSTPTTEKVAEIQQTLADGATELDVVLNVGLFKSELTDPELSQTKAELEALHQAVGSVPIKLIIETTLLTPDQIRRITQLAAKTGMTMVKTCTGMVAGPAVQGAIVPDVLGIRAALSELEKFGTEPSKVQIKASGGIKTVEKAQHLIDAGASRIGTSSGVELVSNF
ncbi:MAG: deoxyribose-phosphate aldolase [Vampirovibrio sp.]|nr:deoxyribose-phosphate aldolase [Vampirovibrio sp.]